MKNIKIKIINYDPEDRCSYGFFLVTILKKYYEVELSENPDYLFYNESGYEHLKYNCIKIFYTGENLHPNFNLCDYALGFDYMDFGDRYYRLPIYLVANFYREAEITQVGNQDFTKQNIFTKEDLATKTEFCSFVYSNYLGDVAREEFFNKLSSYKKVNAGGFYLNNIGERVANKLEFEMKHKFSIAFENSSREGYTTEKLPTALLARTIPIYWGNPEIQREFNEGRFINCHKYKDFNQVIERVKEIDTDDNLYLQIINKPITTSHDFEKVREGFELFLKNIIDQPLCDARRRKINPMRALEVERNEAIIAKHANKQSAVKKTLASIYRPFKKIKAFERLKQRYFARKFLKK
ncbi:MAG: glycosyltransferase family 10 [Patescibacteria group bacterium]